MYQTLFLFLKPLAFWIKFDTLDSINKIPEDKENLIDFCPICMKKLGTKSTREHKKHDLTIHPRTYKQKVQELVRGATIVWAISAYSIFIGFVLLGGFNLFDDDAKAYESIYTPEVDEFISNCNEVENYYNEKIINETLNQELYNEIKLGMGTCFIDNDWRIFTPSSLYLAEIYGNLTGQPIFSNQTEPEE